MSTSWWSFLTYPTTFLPSPSIPSSASSLTSFQFLPRNLQQRLVAYLLRKSLGGIVRKEGLEGDKVETEWIRGGLGVKLHRLRLDEQAIQPLLETISPTLEFTSGTISHISAQLSHAQLSIVLSNLKIVLSVQDRREAEELLQKPFNLRQGRTETTTTTTLEDSVLSIHEVVQDFVVNELSKDEDLELRQSLLLNDRTQDLSSSTTNSEFSLPGGFGNSRSNTYDSNSGRGEQTGSKVEGEEEVETTLLTGLIERILARLTVKVERINLKLIWNPRGDNDGEFDDEEEDDEKEKNELEVVIDEIDYSGDAKQEYQKEEEERGKDEKREGVTAGGVGLDTSIRSIKVSPPKILLKVVDRSSSSASSTSSSASSSTTSTSTNVPTLHRLPRSPSSSSDETDSELIQSISLPESTPSLPLPRPPSVPTSTSRSTSFASSDESSSSSSSEDDESGDEQDLMIMSQSIADLRTSTTRSINPRDMVGSGIQEERGRGGSRLGGIDESTTSEMFHSTSSFVDAPESPLEEDRQLEVYGTRREETVEDVGRSSSREEDHTEEDPFLNPDSPSPPPTMPSSQKPDAPSSAARSTTPQEPQTNPSRLIVSLGSGPNPPPIVFYLISRRSTSSSSHDDTTFTSSTRTSLEFKSTIESNWIVALELSQIVELLHLSNRLFESSSRESIVSEQKNERPPQQSTGSPTNFDISIFLKSLNIFVSCPSSAQSRVPPLQPSTPTNVDPFSIIFNSKDPTLQSLSPQLKTPHLRFKLDSIWISRSRNNGELKLELGDFGGWDCCEKVKMGNEGKSGFGKSWLLNPLIVFDSNLRLMKEVEGDGAGVGGGGGSRDWIKGFEGTGLGKDWKVKPSTRSSGGGEGARRRSDAIHDRDETDRPKEKMKAIKVTVQRNRTKVELDPVHFFVDLTILNRLGPVITTLSNTLSSSSVNDESGTATPRVGQIPLARPESRSSTSIVISCPLVRIDLRCPAPANLRKEKRDPELLRSGILVVDLEKIEVKKGEEAIEVQVREIVVGMNRVGTGLKVSNFLTVSSLSPSDPASFSPSFSYATTLPPTLRTSLPLVHLKLDKPTLDSLQLFADDLSQFFGSELSSSTTLHFAGSNDSSMYEWYGAGKGKERMIGSRYFGTKSFVRSSNAARKPSREGSEEGTEEGNIKMRIDLDVTDVVVDLLVPSTSATSSSTDSIQHVRVTGSDLAISATTLDGASDDLRSEISIGDVKIEEIASNQGADGVRVLLARTGHRDITSTSVEPLVSVGFSTSADPQTDLKESKVQLALDGITYFFDTRDLELGEDLGRFVKAPEGAFEQVVPNELTRLRLRLSNLSLHITPPSIASHVVVSLNDVTIKTDLMPDLPRTTWTIESRGVRGWAIEGLGDVKEEEGRGEARDGRYWKSRGYVQIVDVETASIVARQGNGLVLPDFELIIADAKVVVAVCADTAAALSAFADDIAKAPALQPRSNASAQPDSTMPTEGPSKKASTHDLLASVDFAAFEGAPSVHDLPEMLSDDVPANVDYLGDTHGQGLSKKKKKGSREHRRSDASLRGESGQVTEDVEGETVRMLDPEGLVIVDDWLAEPRWDESDYSGPASRIRLRLTNSDVTVHLHEGYDWFTTRKAIEEESKAVRRRLEKIRQLLASGQTPDATAENASVLMFGSHQLGLPPGANELNPQELLAAINEELDDANRDDDAVSTAAASSWQSFPGGRATSTVVPRKSAATLVGKARKRLTRSKAFAIEINARGLNANFDQYSTASSSNGSPSSSTASTAAHRSTLPNLSSKVKVEVTSFDIIDNIKTSTWRKFLTELRPSDGGVVRASGAPMARFEMSAVKPVGKVNSAHEEINLKVKISPLRLYIDQDALDFLKGFGAFTIPVKSTSSKLPPQPQTHSTASEPFYQRVEVLPVKIKLDYKPKRVDYYALKQGKTAELMNFFHFDGSEMTLRHLIVTGVSGTTTLSNLVQDIWTPDVKANQLADVISGIAPVRSVVNVGSGMANLVLLPIEQYRKDGRVVRGLQKGASAFAKQTTLEAINVGAKLATGTQVILEQAEHVLGARYSQPVTGEALPSVGSTPASAVAGLPVLDLDDLSDEEIAKVRSRYADQPNDLRQGVSSAYKSLGENFKEAAQTILAVPMEVYERSGSEGPVRAVVRAVPIAVLKPMIGASGAVSKALLGLRNTLDPDQQRGELEDKYKHERRS